jgi:hypothetical protein
MIISAYWALTRRHSAEKRGGVPQPRHKARYLDYAVYPISDYILNSVVLFAKQARKILQVQTSVQYEAIFSTYDQGRNVIQTTFQFLYLVSQILINGATAPPVNILPVSAS